MFHIRGHSRSERLGGLPAPSRQIARFLLDAFARLLQCEAFTGTLEASICSPNPCRPDERLAKQLDFVVRYFCTAALDGVCPRCCRLAVAIALSFAISRSDESVRGDIESLERKSAWSCNIITNLCLAVVAAFQATHDAHSGAMQVCRPLALALWTACCARSWFRQAS